jgi:hypothetical protein
MFRRFAEAWENADTTNDSKSVKSSFLSGVNTLLPAIQTVNLTQTDYQPPVIPPPDPAVTALSTTCSTSSIDQLLAIKNPNAAVDCGWMYTPPSFGETTPIVSQGAAGTKDGPLPDMTQPEYKKWFFDLQLAKKQMMLDKCKALKACEDVDSNVFQGSCGYCPEAGRGVPVDQVGKPLYADDKEGACSNVITSSKDCKPVEDSVCKPIDGRLSAECIQRQVLSAGCQENGALALALSRGSSTDYLGSIVNEPSVKIYNMVANPPLRLDIFKTGKTTADTVLQEAAQLFNHTNRPASSALGATARDLCLQAGTSKDFDFCSDLPDSTTPPYNITCLQRLFTEMGGKPVGKAYPNDETIHSYQNMPNLGAVKQYIHTLLKNKQSKDLKIQFQAVYDLFGISPDSLVRRCPFQQGVEVFWFVPVQNQPTKVFGLLKRTIESDLVQYPYPTTNMVSQIDTSRFFTMLQLTDVRAEEDRELRIGIQTNDGFWVTVNQPTDADGKILSSMKDDKKGVFANLQPTGDKTTYVSNACTVFRGPLPNVTKVYYENSNGGSHFFRIQTDPCSEKSTPLVPSMYSLTCEPRAPFLLYEVDLLTSEFQELRNPILFGQFLGRSGFEYHTRSEETMRVPGKKGFIRMSSAKSCINMPSIAYQSWGTMTIAIRLRTMPVKETIANFRTAGFYYSIVAMRDKDGVAKIHIEHNFGKQPEKQKTPTIERTPFQLELNTWYLVVIQNKVTGFDLSCESFEKIVAMNGAMPRVPVEAGIPLFQTNMTWKPAPDQPFGACNILIGTDGFTTWPSVYSTVSFHYDIAWVHFFDYHVINQDILREAKVNWIYTAFPDAPYSYKVNLS